SKGGARGKWEKFWVVLEHSRIYEYRDTGLGKPEAAHAVIDLKFASVREGRGTDRRFVFEIVTPSHGRRLYQATSDSEMKQWLYAICNAIESCINGTSSVRTFDASKLRTVSGSLDDHALPTRRVLGLGLPIPAPNSTPNPNLRKSMPPEVPSSEDRRTRKTSFKKVMRQSREIASDKWADFRGALDTSNGSNSSAKNLDIPRSKPSRPVPSRSSTSNSESQSGRLTPVQATLHSSSPSSSRWFEESVDGEIEKKVLEMAGIGSGVIAPSSSSGNRRVISEGGKKLKGSQDDHTSLTTASEMVRSKSADTELGKKDEMDMQVLRRIADENGNDRCADCGKGMRSSRWATLSLREWPMVMFLCIRCCGLHRGLGTHISKPRSVDLDIWSAESIALAVEWGNRNGNAVWERLRPEGVAPGDADIADFIKAKYVEGRWLGDEDRERVGLRGREL
ncbi:hypothetical protein P7C73_g5792, partial [Tremellales sp. Uapishka_1]